MTGELSAAAEAAPTLDELEQRLSGLRSLKPWPQTNLRWESIEAFERAETIETGIHSFAVGPTILDVFIDVCSGAPAYVFFHGNCPRADSFKLPVFSGSTVSSGLYVTKVVPSDPALLLESNLELAWHAGTRSAPLQSVYRRVFAKVFQFGSAPHAVFWGGSGGGFAALYYSFYFADSIAMVWNPQTVIWKYLPDGVAAYQQVAVGQGPPESVPRMLGEAGIQGDLTALYAGGHENRIVYLQNAEDWHTEVHLMPLLSAMNLRERLAEPASHSGLISDKFYLFFGDFSEEPHGAPPSRVIAYCLNQLRHTDGDVKQFDFAALFNHRQLLALSPPWLVDAMLRARIAKFRNAWPAPDETPAVDAERPTDMRLQGEITVQLQEPPAATWGHEFTTDVATNVAQLYSLTHVGRLLTLYERKPDDRLADAAFAILDSFFRYIEAPSAWSAAMTNRDMGRAAYALSSRANVLAKLLQLFGSAPERRPSLVRPAMHLLEVSDHLCNDSALPFSHDGMKVALALLQVAAQLDAFASLHFELLSGSGLHMLKCVAGAHDAVGETLPLLREYCHYCSDNRLAPDGIQELRQRLELAETAT